MATTARDIIKGSLRLIGAIASGENPSASELSDGLDTLNEMLDSWSNESLLIHAKIRETFPLVGGKQSYSMGPSGDFDTSRPQRIENALLQDSSASPQYETPIKILVQDQWAAIPIKDISTSIPTELYVEDTYPLAALNFWPIPSEAKNVVLYSWKPLTNFATADTTITLPPGYLKALRYNLALELSPEFGREPSALIVNSAVESKANIKRMNIKPMFLKIDSGLLRGKAFDWRTGE